MALGAHGVLGMLKSTRDQVIASPPGSQPPVVSPTVGYTPEIGRVSTPDPDTAAALASRAVPAYYIPLNIEIAKSYVIHPTNQGQRGGIAARQVMMFEPRNSPSRSQKSEGYTEPLQAFSAGYQMMGNTWQTPSGQSTAGKLPRQPSTKFVSPFQNTPIPTRMPWDL